MLCVPLSPLERAGLEPQSLTLLAPPNPAPFSSSSPARPSAQARTPVGSFQGALKAASAVQLGVAAVKGVLSQSKVPADQIEDLYFGQVLQGGAGQSPARQVVIGAGLPESTEATTVNKVRPRRALLPAPRTSRKGCR